MKKNQLTTKEAAEVLSVSESTVKRYADSGLIEYIRIGNSGHRRYLKESIDNYIIDQKNNASEIHVATINNGKPKLGNLKAHSHPKHYLMHKYWGRKAHNIVRQYIEYFTSENQVVLDPFMGSGVTVIESLKTKRRVIGVDLNPMSISIVRNSISSIDLEEFQNNYNKIFSKVVNLYGNLYESPCPVCNKVSKINCSVWEFEELLTLKGECEIHGKFVKKATGYDLKIFQKSEKLLDELSKTKKNLIPTDKIPQYVKRNNKETIDELFSKRALLILAEIKYEINKLKNKDIRELFDFIFTSMLANCSSMLPGDPEKGIYKSGWVISKFWVPNIHAERNVIDCFELRFNAIKKGKKELKNIGGENAEILNLDSRNTTISSESVDYIFTDPPYGESIAYFSLSHLWNTWLKNKPKFEDEIIIDNFREKDYEDYSKRIGEAFKEMYRVLKPESYLSFTFHNRDLNVWKAIIDACTNAGFKFESAILQEQAVSSGTQGINKNNTLTGDFVYTYKKSNCNKPVLSKPCEDGEVFIVNSVQDFLIQNGAVTSSQLYEFIIPEIINNYAVLDKKGKVINLEKLLLSHFDYKMINNSYKWDRKEFTKDKKENKFSVLDLFAGAGGLSNGFEKAGFDIVAAVEYDKRIEKTYLYNHPNTKLIVDDIRNVSGSEKDKRSEISIENIFKQKSAECDVIIGGPPCQGFSMAGNRIRKDFKFFNDKRNYLFLEYYRMVKDLNPKFFVIENVPGILNYNNGSVKREIIEKFEALGYNVTSKVLSANEFGVPQLRKRAFFIGNRLGLNSEELFPEPQKNPKKFISAWEAIGDLPELEPGEGNEKISTKNYKERFSNYQINMRSSNGYIFNHVSSKPTPKTIEILKLIKEGQGIKDLPREYHTKSIHSGAYGRIDRTKPSYTITTRINTPSVGRITHPLKNRTITPREAARIQSFDDSYRFFGNITSLGIQIGNAVPPLLAKAIAEKLKKYLE
ncbi:DNA (cytosine-5-)-methyltransferase [Aestuariibaculum lutulentum]|uniref:Cytosine-specific methyltransferase n=1 Tax=Aestuariibaculum lutulentum TaxID=2920935 RepID=A0ABS9RGD4_9FLAO|nr:DNA (cytosine-5-)-methyltransferase [Aestuariibaculum lutulentum]MCH4551977.1 DNA (cytosine-5-)-methyltransferase [Aestuariibaculum lutulentum]